MKAYSVVVNADKLVIMGMEKGFNCEVNGTTMKAGRMENLLPIRTFQEYCIGEGFSLMRFSFISLTHTYSRRILRFI